MRRGRVGDDAKNVGSNCPVIVELEFIMQMYKNICEDYKTQSMRILTSIITCLLKDESEFE